MFANFWFYISVYFFINMIRDAREIHRIRSSIGKIVDAYDLGRRNLTDAIELMRDLDKSRDSWMNLYFGTSEGKRFKELKDRRDQENKFTV